MRLASAADQDAVRELVQTMAEARKVIRHAPTNTVAQVTAMLHPLTKAVESTLTAAKDTLKERVQKGEDTTFTQEDKQHVIMAGAMAVAVQERERLTERDGAVDWLRKNYPSIFDSSIVVSYTIEDEEEVAGVAEELEEAATAVVSWSREKLQKLVERSHAVLNKQITQIVRLNQDAIAQAITDKVLTRKEVEKHLFEINTSYAVTVTERKPKDAEDE